MLQDFNSKYGVPGLSESGKRRLNGDKIALLLLMTLLRKDTATENCKDNNLFPYFFSVLFQKKFV